MSFTTLADVKDSDLSCSSCGSRETPLKVIEIKYTLENNTKVSLNAEGLYMCINCEHVGRIRTLIF